MPSLKPSLAELRPVCQPDGIMERTSAEHWTGRLYMRRVSLYLTRALLQTRITADQVTWLMILSGLAAAAVVTVPALWSAIAAVALTQLQMLFDCSDGEVARWRRTTGATGIYLDRIGHYSTEAGLIAALGVRADGGITSIAGWTTLGLVGAALVLMTKAETDLVHVARALSGRQPVTDAAAVPRPVALRGLRRVAALLPFHRAIGSIELALLLLVAAGVDAATGSLVGSRGLTAVLVAIAAVVCGGHLLSILSSSRLR